MLEGKEKEGRGHSRWKVGWYFKYSEGEEKYTLAPTYTYSNQATTTCPLPPVSLVLVLAHPIEPNIARNRGHITLNKSVFTSGLIIKWILDCRKTNNTYRNGRGWYQHEKRCVPYDRADIFLTDGYWCKVDTEICWCKVLNCFLSISSESSDLAVHPQSRQGVEYQPSVSRYL